MEKDMSVADLVLTLLAEAKVLRARSVSLETCARRLDDAETLERARDMVQCSGNMLRFLVDNKDRLSARTARLANG
jgi:hypothetical protein